MLVKLINLTLKNKGVKTSEGVIHFDADGVCMVEESLAKDLITIPSYRIAQETLSDAHSEEIVKEESTYTYSEEELASKPYNELKKIASEIGVESKGVKKALLIENILKASK